MRLMMQQNVALIVSGGAITTQSVQLQAVPVVS
ncbi:hypothetical protein EATG_02822 [Escherichia coli H605]|uniref:Uncharacterized protein n=1 Tax=Escherichia coli H605 TaxID=656410 RepID=A0AAJ3NYT3_ECOLX|nr:hypothetical protein EATG_02822 [Escherichia coli H605]